jgi:hypothetical protein
VGARWDARSSPYHCDEAPSNRVFLDGVSGKFSGKFCELADMSSSSYVGSLFSTSHCTIELSLIVIFIAYIIIDPAGNQARAGEVRGLVCCCAP